MGDLLYATPYFLFLFAAFYPACLLQHLLCTSRMNTLSRKLFLYTLFLGALLGLAGVFGLVSTQNSDFPSLAAASKSLQRLVNIGLLHAFYILATSFFHSKAPQWVPLSVSMFLFICSTLSLVGIHITKLNDVSDALNIFISAMAFPLFLLVVSKARAEGSNVKVWAYSACVNSLGLVSGALGYSHSTLVQAIRGALLTLWFCTAVSSITILSVLWEDPGQKRTTVTEFFPSLRSPETRFPRVSEEFQVDDPFGSQIRFETHLPPNDRLLKVPSSSRGVVTPTNSHSSVTGHGDPTGVQLPSESSDYADTSFESFAPPSSSDYHYSQGSKEHGSQENDVTITRRLGTQPRSWAGNREALVSVWSDTTESGAHVDTSLEGVVLTARGSITPPPRTLLYPRAFRSSANHITCNVDEQSLKTSLYEPEMDRPLPPSPSRAGGDAMEGVETRLPTDE